MLPQTGYTISPMNSATRASQSGMTLSQTSNPIGDDSTPDDDGITPAVKRDLFSRVHNNRYRQVEQMFSSGIPADTQDERGNTALSLSCQTGNKKMAKLCLRWGAKVNQQNLQGQTPLHFCFAYHYDELGAYLISKGGDDTILNYFGWSPYEGLRPEDPQEVRDVRVEWSQPQHSRGQE